ncbi:MAG TPA: class I SAM-dependent methyltransferase [Thermoplasmata archaeon]
MGYDLAKHIRWGLERFLRPALRPCLGEIVEWGGVQTTDRYEFLASLGIPEGAARSYDTELETALKQNPYVRVEGLPFSGRWAVARGAASVLYAIARSRRPTYVLETGVANGFSSYAILSALAANEVEHPGDGGFLTSFDPAPDTGRLVPVELRKGRWDLVRGVFDTPSRFDLFFHDSLHTYANMLREYWLAWPGLPDGGLLLSDDVESNFAFIDFARSVRVRPATLVSARSVFGVLVKPAGGR